MTILYQGQWRLMPGKILREFRLTLPDGRRVNFSVKPGECLKQKLAEVLKRFNQVAA